MKILQFTLSMPNVGSWNGKWSGEGDLYAVTKKFGNRDSEITDKLLKEKYYHYNFGDGWSAGISIKQIDSKDAIKVRRYSKGFCGYDWMIDSILQHGKILIKEEK